MARSTTARATTTRAKNDRSKVATQATATQAETEARAAARAEKFDKARAILAGGLDGIGIGGEALAAYLRFRSKFWRFSVNNVLMILSQNPTARYCMGFRQWIDNGRSVQKGEKSMMIWVPSSRKPTAAEIVLGADPAEPLLFFMPGSVFDYAQTAPIEGHPNPLTYVCPIPVVEGDEFAPLLDTLTAAAVALGFSTEFKDCGTANGYADCDNKIIAVDPRNPVNQQVKTFVHELAHVIAHDSVSDRDRKANRPTTSRSAKEVEAEGAAFLVCASLGLDTSGYSLPYVLDWAGESGSSLIIESLTVIDKTAREILLAIGSPLIEPKSAAATRRVAAVSLEAVEAD